MNDFEPSAYASQRRTRIGTIVAVVVAFVAGLALMAYGMRHGSRWASQSTAPAMTQAGRVPVSANPTPAHIPDMSVLAEREVALAAQLAALESRAEDVTANAAAAGGQATRAESLLVAFAARRAIDRGLGLGYIEQQLQLRFGNSQPRATLVIIDAARQPVTLEDLRLGLDAIANDLVTGSHDGWWPGLRRTLGNMIVLHKAGTPSPLPGDRLSRARRLLDGAQVEAALAEVQRLPGVSRAGNWTDAARRYVEVHRALDRIESAAILGQSTPVTQPLAPQPAPAPTPAAPTAAQAATPQQ